jgi:hypothetical protein
LFDLILIDATAVENDGAATIETTTSPAASSQLQPPVLV